MNELKLSKRLSKVAEYIPEGSILADIGSDHAYLPCYAVIKGKAKNAIAGEVVEGPYRSALSQVKRSGLDDRIAVRKGDGLAVLETDEATCITIAGMGGGLIAKILENGKDKLGAARRLILQPNVNADLIRIWLINNGWELKAEEILEEDRKIYEILTAEKGEPLKPYDGADKDAGILFGPFLMKEKNDVFIQKWEHEKEHWERIAAQISRGIQTEETAARKADMLAQIKRAEEVLS
ncbi:tRNA (adenine(22)-N(1))-methyltransferase TrmK [Bacillus mangrovi]|uniref:tRNA (Adenine(22)-N(1))-methyltransferase TrmK n=1 Tax=Metabacillus mangrovi TaxID=1491830 RepID=A0A7X2S3B0_9BACI|nr:tRNA (adenine(22)-N(1))-methyltransferase TrmK [Metabacillus mangrovi]MTH52451.1 tRNA (adenine(22)-N(1))-methyltransferase TrmK [Metabacillus mangrovi]